MDHLQNLNCIMYYTCNEKHKTKSDLLNKKFLSDANVTNLSNLSIKK